MLVFTGVIFPLSWGHLFPIDQIVIVCWLVVFGGFFLSRFLQNVRSSVSKPIVYNYYVVKFYFVTSSGSCVSILLPGGLLIVISYK